MTSPRPESELLHLCARQRLTDAHRRRAGELSAGAALDWEQFYFAADTHRIAPLVLENLQALGLTGRMPPAVLQRFRALRLRSVALAAARAAKVDRFLQFTNAQDIRVMLVKGAAMDHLVYRQPWYVVSDDLDMLVEPRFADLPADTLDQMRLLLRGQPPIEVEFFRHHDVDMNNVVPVVWADLWGRSRTIAVGRRTAHVMSPEDLLLTACVNLCRKGFGRLKETLAIAQVIEVGGPIGWDRFAHLCRQGQGRRIAYAGLRIAELTLGIDPPLPNETLVKLGLRPARRRLIESLIRRLRRGDQLGVGGCDPSASQRRLRIALRFACYNPRQAWQEIKVLYRLRTNPGKDPLLEPTAVEAQARPAQVKC